MLNWNIRTETGKPGTIEIDVSGEGNAAELMELGLRIIEKAREAGVTIAPAGKFKPVAIDIRAIDIRENVIEMAKGAIGIGTFECHVECTAGPGAWEGIAEEDRELAVAIHGLAMEGVADEIVDHEAGGYMERIGRFVLLTDTQGFKSLIACESAQAAEGAVAKCAAPDTDPAT